MHYTLSRLGVALSCALSFISASEPVLAGGGSASAEITRTRFGVPHIQASSERGLGLGIGYAYGQDNLCLLAGEVMTVNGERSRWLGAEGKTFEGHGNLASDLFFKWLNTTQALENFWQAQPAALQARIDGYVAGFNKALEESRAADKQVSCAHEPWLRPVTRFDVLALVRRLQVEGGVGRFAEALAGAAPPQAANAALDRQAFSVAARQLSDFALERGSNAVAIGGELSANGRGLLLANPHFPWNGGLRFYQMHLTIPGQLDVMGAALPGLPLINIGFNQHVAWSHTVDTSKHFTLYRLTLDPKDSTRYVFDGQSLPLQRRTVTVQVKGRDGKLQDVSRTLYSSRFGPVVQWPGKLEWDSRYAYSLRDANLGNDRVLKQWYAMNRATSVEGVGESLRKVHGIPWVNTLAVDDRGVAGYFNYAVVPYVDAAKLKACGLPSGEEAVLLEGSRGACDWASSDDAGQSGIFPASAQPSLLRPDFLQNSNDSAWMTNPSQPLTGFAPIVSREGVPLGARARFALERLARLKASGKVNAEQLQAMVTDNRVYLAESGGVLDDLLAFCNGEIGQAGADLRNACDALGRWDRTAGVGAGLGVVHFQHVAEGLLGNPKAWRIPFDPANPVYTPRGVALQQADVRKAVQDALQASVQRLQVAKVGDTATWGELQVSFASGEPIGIPGAFGGLGVYNAMQSVPRGDGRREVVSGSSYLQVVGFDDHGPHARGLLAFSESSEPGSPHAADQTREFVAGRWATLPFSEAQIKADPEFRVQRIQE